MTTDDDIRRAGDRLAAVAVPVPDLGRRARRAGRVRAAGAIGAVALLAGVGALWAWPDDEGPSIEVRTAQHDRGVPTYDLGLEGAALVGDESVSAVTTDTAIWADEAGNAHVSLTVRPGLAEAYPEPAGFGPVEEDTDLTAAQGRAWFTVAATGEVGSVRVVRMWWSRPDGDVWLLTASWHDDPPAGEAQGRAALHRWALAIRASTPTDDQGPYRMEVPEMERVASDRAGEVRSRARTWRYQGHDITLLTTEDAVAAGMANLFALGPNAPQHATIDGHDGWTVTAGATTVGWPDGTDPPTWATLTIPPELAQDADAIVTALHRA